MALNWNVIGTVAKELEISYNAEGKPYGFLRVSTRRDWVKDPENPNETHDFTMFGDFSIVASECNVGDCVALSGIISIRKKNDEWIKDFRVKEFHTSEGKVTSDESES